MRLAQDVLEKSGLGVISVITSGGYLLGPIFAGVRKSLRNQLSCSSLLDLNGSIRRGAAGDDDENIFDIQQGVAVFVGSTARKANSPPLHFGEIIGSRADKFAALNSGRLGSLCAIDIPTLPPNYQFRPMDGGWHDLEFWPLPTIFGTGDPSKDRNKLYSAGFETRQDGFVIAFDDDVLLQRISDLSNPALSRADLAARYRMCSTAHFKFDAARARAANGDLAQTLKTANYRPFDARRMIWSRFVLCEPQHEVTQHIDDGDLCLVASRAVTDAVYAHAFVSRGPYEKIGLSNKTSSNAYMFPLRRKLVGTETGVLPNIAPAFATRIAALTGLSYDDCVEGPKQGALGGILPKKAEQTAMFAPARRERGEPGKSFGPRDLFDYIYAVLHSPAYRARYADYLKSDFARIPLPGSRALFEALVPLGTELVALHLLDADALPILKHLKGIRLAGSGDARVMQKPEYDAKLGRVTINATRWFESVPQTAWDFHVGGYQPAQKWLKDRAARGGKKASDGRVLTDDDILHYCRMIVALTRTAELMPQIDAVVQQHGSWPGAFIAESSTAPVQLPAPVALPDGSWVWLSSIQPRDRLRYAAQYALWQMDIEHDASRLRFVIASLAEPALLTPLLSDDDRAAWLRLIGPEAQPSVGVVRLRPEVNGAWRGMFEKLITSGQLTEQSDGSWVRGQYFSDSGLERLSVDAQRGAFALRAVRAMEVGDLQTAIAAEDNVVWARFGNG